MKLGASVGGYGPSASSTGMVNRAAMCEQVGLDSVWVSDRVVVPSKVATPYPFSRHGGAYDPVSAEIQYEALISLAVLGATTQSLAVGVSVLALPLREPMLLARQVATVHAMVGGRVIIGVGVGWLREEFDIAAPGAWPRRGRLTDDYLQLLRTLWTMPGDVPFTGAEYHASAVRFEPKPVPPPRIEVGGNSATAIKRAARFGDAWQPMQLDPADVRAAADRMRSLQAEAGRGGVTVGITMRCNLDVSPAPPDDQPAWHIGGSDERIADALGQYAEAGVDAVLFDLVPDDDESRSREALERVCEIRHRTVRVGSSPHRGRQQPHE